MSPPDLNNPRLAAGAARQPRCAVTVNGVTLSGVVEAEVTNASHFTADTFRVVCSASGLQPAFGPAYWALSVGDLIGVSVGFADAAPVQLILGQVDDAQYDPISRTLTLSGRDLSAPLIDAKTAEKFVNLTSSQIAEQLARRHGLEPVVEATSARAGSYYEIDNVVLTQEQTEWDLLVYLAGREGFDCWVSGNRLFFQPSPAAASVPYKLVCQASENGLNSSALDIKLSRSQTLARDVIVKVQSWNQKQQRSFVVTYKVTQAFKSQRSGGKSQTYSFTVPNLDRDQALKLAKAKAEDITRHERVLTASLPGDNLLTTRSMVQLVGTNTAWDQNYYPDTVTRTLSVGGGYRMELRAKNHSTQSTVTLG
ncbi:phage late control D family protein [Zavarzinella formosa]|uniref:phage late control D family protein n=1 Tax=Zavarzinella formosa TaxID=360055 RepID=UPI0002EF9CED|nr:phage late control D family protein [Zavarzinella formosa]